jgi:hypothetical protein
MSMASIPVLEAYFDIAMTHFDTLTVCACTGETDFGNVSEDSPVSFSHCSVRE